MLLQMNSRKMRTHIEDGMARDCKRWEWIPYLLTEHSVSFDAVVSPVLAYPLPYPTELETVLASWIYNHHETNDWFQDVSVVVNLAISNSDGSKCAHH